MNHSQYAEFQTERDLHNCGLTQDSIEAIKATSIVTHNGAQHVVPESQVGRFDHTEIRSNEQASSSNTGNKATDYSDSSLRNQLDEQQRMFSRFKQYADKRISNLENGLQQAAKELNDMKREMETLKSNQKAQNKMQDSHSHQSGAVVQNQGQQNSSQVRESAQQDSQPQNASDDKPIDRNKTAPSDVKVESIFYCGQR